MPCHLDPAGEAVRSVAAASLDVYEAWIRALTEVEHAVAAAVAWAPTGALVGAVAEATRDMGAIQLSNMRWLMDL
jgi:hypothetical protein